MPKYNFDEILNRRGTNSLKWNVGENELPMWVADMDFRTAPEITEALQKRLALGAYGYSVIPDEWSDAYIHWWKERHHLGIRKEELIFSTGVIPTVSSTVRKLTTPNENVVIQTPVYNIFFNCIVNNGARVLENPLILKDGRWEMDFEDLEKKLADPQTSLMILCNPHNPVGRIWTREELSRVGELCAKYGVTVISDEIHCDIADPGKEYVPFAGVSETCRSISVTAIAPTKCFNIAGLNTSAALIPDRILRHKVWRQLNTDECGEPNFLAVTAAVTAFEKGGEWLDEMNAYVRSNKDYAIDFIRKNIPEIDPLDTEATYLLWADCRKATGPRTDLQKFIRKETGLYVSCGEQYGATTGQGFLRINLACPRALVEDGMRRLADGIRKYTAAL